MTATTKNAYRLAAYKSLFAGITRKWGNGWKLLGDDLKRAVIGQEVMFVFTGRPDEDKFAPSSLFDYYQGMLDFCGLGN
jgi:hypothetical protein